MKTTYLDITDDFEARKIYEKTYSYSRASSNTKEITFEKPQADNKEHKWREENLEFLNLNTKVKLIFYSFPNEIPKEGLAMHTLEIEILGQEQARNDTMRKLEMITGRNIEQYLPKT